MELKWNKHDEFSNLRIHVERVIGNVRKKYSFLSQCQPVEFLSQNPNEDVTTLNKNVTIGCCLNNLCNSVVPTDLASSAIMCFELTG